MKLCTCCGSDVGDDFYAGVPQRHRKCHAAAVRENRRQRSDYYRQYDKARAKRPDRVEARKEYAATDRGRDVHAKALRRSAEKHPQKASARIAFGNAVRDGRVKKEPCEVCGKAKAQGHHPDYSKPLEVRWLCSRHHADVHRGRLVLRDKDKEQAA